ncbi:MAG: 3-oxoacyl-[acyl-carrier-protein] reductase FabG [bacterium]|nr:3-oxoacyl-[acyl-carrier-protein] reductase FabG [bacterium]
MPSSISPAFENLALPGLRDRVVLITGAVRGIGRVTAELLARCGAALALHGRLEAETQQVANELQQQFGVRTLAAAAEVTDLAAVRQMFEALQSWSNNRLDILVCCAGYPLVEALWKTPLHQMPESQVEAGFKQVRAVDLDGARFCSHFALKMMVPQRRGSIVYISSTPALAGYHGTPYTEAKAALLGLMRDLAREYAPHNIRVNAVAPGNIASGWYHQLSAAERQKLAIESPMQRWGLPEEVAGAIVFLASDLAGYITGQTLVVDGGVVRR